MAVEGLTRALNQQTAVLSTLLGERGHTPPVGQAALAAPVLDHQMNGFLDFWQCHPPTFEGGTNHSTVATWLRKIVEILYAKGYSNEQRVRFAPLMLKGEAELWWRGLQGRMADWDTPITWETFRTIFLERLVLLLCPARAHGEGLFEEEEEGGGPSVQHPGRTSSLGSTTHQNRSKWKTFEPVDASLIPKSLARPHQEAPHYLPFAETSPVIPRRVRGQLGAFIFLNISGHS
ncbi:hypothetical protein SESBI_07269 [Sesbania bispinosa]|nr:hypothetical protein SESBI_07269 [Sesbania bispinosa]